MVRGRCMVSCGVFILGDESPNAPMELGVKSEQPFSLDISRRLSTPPIWIFHANNGRFSACADNMAAKLYIESILYLSMMAAICWALVTSAISKGPPFFNSSLRGTPSIYPATTLSLPYSLRSFVINAEPICPVAPITRCCFIVFLFPF